MIGKLEKWNNLLDAIEKEVTWLLVARDIFWVVQQIIRSNSDIQKPSSFYSFLAKGYADSTVRTLYHTVVDEPTPDKFSSSSSYVNSSPST